MRVFHDEPKDMQRVLRHELGHIAVQTLAEKVLAASGDSEIQKDWNTYINAVVSGRYSVTHYARSYFGSDLGDVWYTDEKGPGIVMPRHANESFAELFSGSVHAREDAIADIMKAYKRLAKHLDGPAAGKTKRAIKTGVVDRRDLERMRAAEAARRDVFWTDEEGNPSTPDEGTRFEIWEYDGEGNLVTRFWGERKKPGKVTAGEFREWSEEDHPRHPAGSAEGGQFAPAGVISGETKVGITSATPEHQDPAAIEREGGAFATHLRSLGIRDVRFEKGAGSWTNAKGEVEAEPAWVLRYKGNGKALKAIADEAREAKQEAVVLWRRAPSEHWLHRFDFEGDFDAKAVSQAAAKAGLTGWTLDAKGIQTGAVPQWGNPRDHFKAAFQFRAELERLGLRFRHRREPVKVRVISREKGYAIDDEA